MTKGTLLLVIPAVIHLQEDQLLVDGDFANNVIAYLAAFDRVHVMCPATTVENTFPSTVSVCSITGRDRLEVTVLPLPYREDRYFLNRRSVVDKLKSAIIDADYRLISPHSAFDWSTLAAKICIKLNKPYNMEADWNLPEVRKDLWRAMPFGFDKLRKGVARWLHDRDYYHSLAKSKLSLLQGGDVFHDLGWRAANPFRVLNVQVTQSDHIRDVDLDRKLERIVSGGPAHLIYAGRAADIKGPSAWIDTITLLRDWGCDFTATWIGDGELLSQMRATVKDRQLEGICLLPGKMERPQTRALVGSADIFLFCHLAKESPRCLVEALAFGTPIVGFGTNYPRDLVGEFGGGEFVERGQVRELATLVRQLIDDRDALARLTAAAAASGRALDMQTAIHQRIDLMKEHLGEAIFPPHVQTPAL